MQDAGGDDAEFMNKVDKMSGGDDADANGEEGDPLKDIFGIDVDKIPEDNLSDAEIDKMI